jgi:Spy/CpxP family protein refolding chaperone
MLDAEVTVTSASASIPLKERTVRKPFAFIVSACLLGAPGFAWASASQSPPASQSPAASTAKPTVDDVLKAVRDDLQGARTDIMAKNLTLTAEQAAKFWPVFEKYQKEQNVIMDAQLKGIQKYVDGYESLDDAGALALINAHFDRDAQMNALRQKWLGEFQKVLPTKLAVRAMQIDRRLSLMAQIEIVSRIPLVHER